MIIDVAAPPPAVVQAVPKGAMARDCKIRMQDVLDGVGKPALDFQGKEARTFLWAINKALTQGGFAVQDPPEVDRVMVYPVPERGAFMVTAFKDLCMIGAGFAPPQLIEQAMKILTAEGPTDASE